MDAYLGEIAKGYGIAWSPPSAETDAADDDDGDGGAETRMARARVLCEFALTLIFHGEKARQILGCFLPPMSRGEDETAGI